jgi:hypothetical protein
VLLGIVLLFVLYCAVGSYRNHRDDGTSFPESIPHKEFWYSLPERVGELLSTVVMRVKAWREGYQMPEGSVAI